MPLEKVGTKWRYGKKGKLYSTKAKAVKQMKAIKKNGYLGKSK